MIIWKGHGILILVFGVIGAVAGSMLGGVLFAGTQSIWMGRVSMCAPFWGAALAIGLYAKTMGKSSVQSLLDPATQRHVLIRKSHTLFFIPPMPWAVLAILAACVVSFFAVVVPSSSFEREKEVAGTSAFEQANELISADQGQEAYGNTPEAEKLAADFAKTVKQGRQRGVESGKESTVSLSNGKCLTYCRINADSCVFMVHVPGLRKFTKEAKAFITHVAWAVAMKSASGLKPQPRRLAVGIRGALLYDTVIEGHIVANQVATEEGVDQRHTGDSPQKFLAPYFVEPSESGSPEVQPEPKLVAEAPASKLPDPAPTPVPAAQPSADLTLPTPLRDWKDTTGRIMNASLESFTSPSCDTGHFKRADGQGFDVPVARLSVEDQELIRKIAQKQQP